MNIETNMDESSRIFKLLQGDIDRLMCQLVADGCIPNTIIFRMAKLSAMVRMAEGYKKNNAAMDFPVVIDLLSLGTTDAVTLFLYKMGFNFDRWVKVALWFRKLRYIIQPVQIYLMDGHKLYFNWLDTKSRYIFDDYSLKSIWEPETTEVVKKVVKKGDVCLDIGASIGYFTLLESRLTGPTGSVYAFEPMSRGYKYLCKNIKINGYADRAQAFQVGAWDKSEVVGMPRCDTNPTLVQCVSISEFLAERGVEKVDFIKMDIDGSEPWALRGLIPIFEKSPKLKMVCEFYPKYITNAGGNPQEVLDILNKYFTLTVIPGDYGDGYWNYNCERKI